MPFDIGVIKAETHTPEYLMHKYWARKPHNVISECIEKLTSQGEIVVDPFCGSGVTIREAALLGRKAIGFDLNPAAVLISRVLISPPPTTEFVSAFEKIYDKAYALFGDLYKTEDERTIKYLSHRIIARCECGAVLRQQDCIKEGKRYSCPNCGKIVRFNLESLCDTEVFNIAVENDKSYCPSSGELERQKALSNYSDDRVDMQEFDFEFPENRRILSFSGIHTSSFFTPRNYMIISYFAHEIWQIKDKQIRECCLLLLTSSVAQCSRLIANRNNLSTGGPAWSVPGFWIPQEHLETNPFVHFRARLSKFRKALSYIEKHPITETAEVHKGNSIELLNSSTYSSLKADLIFLDPPYGDSVPYTEFSNLWNSFLREIPASDDDISVSDRIEKSLSWENYNTKLHQYMECFTHHIKLGGKLLITFNNNDMRAWTSLISALQDNGFVCQSVFYQIPAVISSKAQMSIDSSYISDVYSIYTYNPRSTASVQLEPLIAHLCFVANSREGTVPKTVLDREFIISWLKNNIDHTLLSQKEEIIERLFDYDKTKGVFVLKEAYRETTVQLKDFVIQTVDQILREGPCSILDCYIRVTERSEQFGTMELSEFRDIISEYPTDNGKLCGYTQLSLF